MEVVDNDRINNVNNNRTMQRILGIYGTKLWNTAYRLVIRIFNPLHA